MPFKAPSGQRRGRVLHSKHRAQLSRARDSLVLTPLSPTIRRRSPSAEMPVAGPSSQPFDNLSLARYRSASTSTASVSSASASAASSSSLTFYPNPLPPTPAISPMDLDTASQSSMSIATDDFPDDHSDGASTVVPMQGIDCGQPQVPAIAYWATPIELDNLRNAIHFMHHATILVSNTYNALRAQNPHCHRFPPA